MSNFGANGYFVHPKNHGGIAIALDRMVMLTDSSASPPFPINKRAVDAVLLRDIHIQVKLPEKLRQKLEAEQGRSPAGFTIDD